MIWFTQFNDVYMRHQAHGNKNKFFFASDLKGRLLYHKWCAADFHTCIPQLPKKESKIMWLNIYLDVDYS